MLKTNTGKLNYQLDIGNAKNCKYTIKVIRLGYQKQQKRFSLVMMMMPIRDTKKVSGIL